MQLTIVVSQSNDKEKNSPSCACRLLGLLILCADVIFILVDILLKDQYEYRRIVIFQLLDLVFSSYFCVEVSIRIIGLGCVNCTLQQSLHCGTTLFQNCRRFYFRRWFEIFDFIIIVTSTMLTVVYILLPITSTELHRNNIIFGYNLVAIITVIMSCYSYVSGQYDFLLLDA